MKRVRVALMALVTGALLLLLSVGSRAQWQAGDVEHGLLRLSWRMRPERLEHCRDRTQTELDALPVHMRTPRICETRVVPYRLTVAIDGAPADTTILLPAGAKHDRPIYVLRDWRLSPGMHHVAVTFARIDGKSDSVLQFDDKLLLLRGHIELISMADSGNKLARVSTQW